MTIVTASYRKKVKRNVILTAVAFIVIISYGAIMKKPPGADYPKEAVSAAEDSPTQNPTARSRSYITAGAIACSEAIDAAQTVRLRRVSQDMAMAKLYPSCFIVGDDLEVRVIRRHNQYPLVLVGNSGGAVWVSEDEVQ